MCEQRLNSCRQHASSITMWPPLPVQLRALKNGHYWQEITVEWRLPLAAVKLQPVGSPRLRRRQTITNTKCQTPQRRQEQLPSPSGISRLSCGGDTVDTRFMGKAQRLARPATPLAACVHRISCTSYRALTPSTERKCTGKITSLEVSLKRGKRRAIANFERKFIPH